MLVIIGWILGIWLVCGLILGIGEALGEAWDGLAELFDKPSAPPPTDSMSYYDRDKDALD